MFAGSRGIWRGRSFYGWRLMAAVIVIGILADGAAGEDIAWDFLPGLLRSAPVALLLPAAGWLISRRWGARRAMLVGAPLAGIGLLLAGLWDSRTGHLIALAPVAVGSILAGWLPAATIVNDHFRRRPATAQAMLLFGASALATLPAYGLALLPGIGGDDGNGRALLIASGALALLIAFPLARRLPATPPVVPLPIVPSDVVPSDVLSEAPSETPAETDPDAGAGQSRATAPEYTLREALRGRDFWLLLAGGECVVVTLSGGLSLGLYAALEHYRVSSEYFYIGYGITALFAMPGGGLLADRLGLRRTLRLCALLGFAGAALMAVSWHPAPLTLAGILMAAGGLGIGGPAVAAVGAYFGRRNFALLTGIGALPSIVTGVLIDFTTGSAVWHQPELLVNAAIIAALAGALAYGALGQPQPAPSQGAGRVAG